MAQIPYPPHGKLTFPPSPPGKDFYVEFHASWTPKSGQMPWGIEGGGQVLNWLVH